VRGASPGFGRPFIWSRREVRQPTRAFKASGGCSFNPLVSRVRGADSLAINFRRGRETAGTARVSLRRRRPGARLATRGEDSDYDQLFPFQGGRQGWPGRVGRRPLGHKAEMVGYCGKKEEGWDVLWTGPKANVSRN
jgi:hypothetical protein